MTRIPMHPVCRRQSPLLPLPRKGLATPATTRPLVLALALVLALCPITAAAVAPEPAVPVTDPFEGMDPASVVLRAVEALEAGDLERAEELAEALPRRPETDGAATDRLLLLGRIALVRDEVERAEDLLQRAVDARGSSDDHLYLGRALLARLQAASLFEKATLAPRVRSAFARAVELDPANAQARVSLASFYLHAPTLGGGSKAKARQHAEALVRLDPELGHPLLAEVLEATGDAAGALEQRRLAVAAAPDSLPRLIELGLAYQAAERWDDAFATFRRSLEIDPDYRHGVYQLGRTGALSGRNLEETAAALERFLADLVEDGEPYHSGAWWRLGMIRQHQGDREAARRAYRRSLEVDPDQRGAREALAELE